jgi:hypothetical protein
MRRSNLPNFNVNRVRPRLHDLPDYRAVGLLRLHGPTLIDSDESPEQFAQRHPFALTVYTLEITDPFPVPSLRNFAISRLQRAFFPPAAYFFDAVVPAGNGVAI